MDTQPKTYGQICMDAYSTCILPGWAQIIERWEAAAQAVISAYKERETVEGWRLVESGEIMQHNDEWWNDEWLPSGLTEGNNSIKKHLSDPLRRRARFLKDSHQQDERTVAPVSEPRLADSQVVNSPAGGTTDPVCIVHGKKMSEHNCLYCCLCFKSLTPDQCAFTLEGRREDVCLDCAKRERDYMIYATKEYNHLTQMRRNNQPTTEGGGHAGTLPVTHGQCTPDDLAAKGPTPEGGDTFLDDVMNAIPASQKNAGTYNSPPLTVTLQTQLAAAESECSRLKEELTEARKQLQLGCENSGCAKERDRLKEELGNKRFECVLYDKSNRNLQSELTACRKELKNVKEELAKVRVCFAEASHSDCQASAKICDLESELALANERVDAKQQAYERCADQLAEAKERLVEYLDSPDNQNRTAAEKLETANRYIGELEAELAHLKSEGLPKEWVTTANNNEKLRDRIDNLESELTKAKRQLTESTRWIPVSERMPTRGDADPYGRVLWANHAATIEQCYIVHGAWNVMPIGCTHWLPIPPIPKPQEDDAERAWKLYTTPGKALTTSYEETFKNGYNAALASGKEKP